MAYRRSLTTSARFLSRQRFASPFCYTHHEDDRKNWHSDEKVKMSFPQCRSFGNSTNTWLGFGGGGMSFRDPNRSQFLHVTSGFLFARNMSTTNGNIGEGEEKIIESIAEKTMEAVVSSEAAAVSEVAVAAADSWLPVAAVQYAIDGIHTYTGLNWWASIVIATLVIKSLSIPLMISSTQLADSMKYFIEKEAKDGGIGGYGYIGMQQLVDEHGDFHLIKLFIQATVFVGFYLAIGNMVEKVPSFQSGGILWFTDLTATDSFRILPYLASISFWNRCKGDPYTIKMKYALFLSLSALTAPLATNFPNALLCYWITSNFFHLVYERMIKKPSVREFVNMTVLEPTLPFHTGKSKYEIALEALEKSVERNRESREKATSSEEEHDHQSDFKIKQ